jgi:teichuronic acid biosynthesis glycosyltransferase TuaG
MSSTAWVTVLTPLFNGIEYFKECYESVLSQTDKDWIWIIGINGHGDDTNQIYQMLSSQLSDKRIYVKNFANLFNKVDTLNEMLEYVNTEYVALLDCDDVWFENKLEIQRMILEKFKHIDVLGTSCKYIGELNHVLEVPEGKVNINTLFTMNPLVNSSVVIKTSVIKQFKYIDRFSLEDYDLWFRLIIEKKELQVFNKPLIYHRIHSDSAFNNSGVQDVSALLNFYRETVCDVTVVSAFFPMKSKFVPKQYLEWIAPFWSSIDCNLVFFTTEEYVPFIESIRSNYSSKTRIICMDFQECNAYKKYSKQFWIDEEKKDFETCHSSDLYAVWYEKKEFVLKAIEKNYFNSSKYVWMDAGICRSVDWLQHIKRFYSYKIPNDSFLILKITDFEEEIDLQKKNCVGGGVLAGTREKWIQFSEKYDDMLQKFVKENKFVGKDQTLIATMYKESPSFFTMISHPNYFNEFMCWFTLLFYLADSI